MDFRQATGRQVSTHTIRNRLHASNLHACRPAVRPILTRRHWARDHVNWHLRHWTPVLFTDESRFCVDFQDGWRRVWRMLGERYVASCIAQHDRFWGASVMVWAGISIGGHTGLYIIDRGALTSVRYRDEILHPIVRPFAVKGLWLSIGILNVKQLFVWPSCFPDLNPIEHAWDMVQRAISNRPRLPENRNEFIHALNEEWQRIPQSTLRRLIRSMQRRTLPCGDPCKRRSH